MIVSFQGHWFKATSASRRSAITRRIVSCLLVLAMVPLVSKGAAEPWGGAAGGDVADEGFLGEGESGAAGAGEGDAAVA